MELSEMPMTGTGDDVDSGQGTGVRRPPPDSDAALYTRHCAEWMRFAASLVGPNAAEDLVSTAVTRALASSGWASVDNKRAYVYRTVFNCAQTDRHAASRRLRREALTASPEAFEQPIADRTIFDALARLSVRQRAVIHLTYWADLAPGAVAALLDTSRRTVERDLTTARTLLKEILS